MVKNRFSLQGRVALVTGAASGIGAHLAYVLAEAGAAVAVTARRRDRIGEVATKIQKAGGKSVAVPMDVTDAASVRTAFGRVETEFGVVEVLVNNAGIAAVAPFVEMTDEQWDGVLDVNLDGVRRVSQLAAQRLIAAGRSGSIVNVSSALGLGVVPNHASYVTSKAACIQLTRAMALELWPKGIRVNALAPGFLQTELNDEFFASEAGRAYVKRTPPGRLGQMEELAGPLLLLASDAGSFMNGSVVVVDAGHSIRLL